MIRYNIIATGSKGNAVKIDDILIDCGVSFKKLKDVYKHIRLVLLTHEHSDHFRPSTIRKLAAERPTLRFGCCRWMVPKLIECGVSPTQIDVYDIGKRYDYKVFALSPIKNYIMTFRTADIGYISDERECYTQQIPEQWKVSVQRDMIITSLKQITKKKKLSVKLQKKKNRANMRMRYEQ